ncbi:MAG: helix-turn-helix domain-containing protein [Candidatus Woesearchaeota archaeon]
MIVKDEFLSKLRRYFNLNLYEVKIWTALLSRGVSTAGELSDIANVPRSRSYDVLESLEKKGFITQKVGKPIKYIALPPEEAIERLKKKIKQDAEQEEKKLEELKKSEILNELISLHSQGIETNDPSEITGTLKGQENIYSYLAYLIKNAKQNIYITTTEKGIIKKSNELLRHLKKAKESGVEITIAAPLSEKTKKEQDVLSNYANLKNIDKPETRFCVSDNKNVAIILTDDEKTHPTFEMAIWTESEKLAKTLLSSVREK